MGTSYKEYSEHKMVEISVDGEVTEKEFDEFAARLKKFIKSHGKVRLVEIITNLGPVSWSILFKGIKFDMAHIKDFSHCALVTNTKWIKFAYIILAPLLPVKIKTFSLDETSDARNWAKNAD